MEQRYQQDTCSRARPSRSTFITSSPAATTDSGCAIGFALEAPLQPNNKREHDSFKYKHDRPSDTHDSAKG